MRLWFLKIVGILFVLVFVSFVFIWLLVFHLNIVWTMMFIKYRQCLKLFGCFRYMFSILKQNFCRYSGFVMGPVFNKLAATGDKVISTIWWCVFLCCRRSNSFSSSSIVVFFMIGTKAVMTTLFSDSATENLTDVNCSVNWE